MSVRRQHVATNLSAPARWLVWLLLVAASWAVVAGLAWVVWRLT